MKTVPGWGKGIGITMIILAALGIFYQFYKIMAPSMFGIQKQIMKDFPPIGQPGNPYNSEQPFNPYNEATLSRMEDLMTLSPFQSNILVISGIIGIILTGFYFAGGIKLISAPKPTNYNFGRCALLSFLIFNILSAVILLSDGFSIFLLAILIYQMIGFVFDMVLWLILISSDKSKYGIGAPKISELYTKEEHNEIL